MSVLPNILTSVIDFCFPPRKTEQLVRTLDISTLSYVPRQCNQHTTALLPFHDQFVQALIYESKFFYNRTAQKKSGQLLVAYLKATYPHGYFVPIPLHPARERTRGFNQVIEMLQTQPGLRAHLVPNLLRRTRNTPSQTSVLSTERAANVAGAFAVNQTVLKKLDLTRPIVLVDDVYTTGATLAAARTALQKYSCTEQLYCCAVSFA